MEEERLRLAQVGCLKRNGDGIPLGHYVRLASRDFAIICSQRDGLPVGGYNLGDEFSRIKPLLVWAVLDRRNCGLPIQWHIP